MKKVYVYKQVDSDVVLSTYSKQIVWDKVWATLDEIDDSDFLTPEERHQEMSFCDPFEGIA